MRKLYIRVEIAHGKGAETLPGCSRGCVCEFSEDCKGSEDLSLGTNKSTGFSNDWAMGAVEV